MYAEGLGIQKDMPTAIQLYEAAATRGEFLAQVELGRIYSRGIGVSPSPQPAFKWYSVAASQQASIADCEELREAKDCLTRKRDEGHAEL